MKHRIYILLFLLLACILKTSAQQNIRQSEKGYMLPVCVYQGDTIPYITLRNVYIYPRIKFKSKKQERYYWKLVRDVKKTLPLAKEIRRAVMETYEYMETLPDTKSRERHMKAVEKGLKEQYTARMKKLTFSQAGFYQTFAALFGASLKKEYHPEDDDKLIERIAVLVENGQL